MTAFELTTTLETVRLWRSGAAARIELHRPESLNAWDARMSADLLTALAAVRDDDEVRAVLLAGAGRAFCSGADLRSTGSGFVTADGLPDVQRSLRERYHPVITGLRRLPKPVVSAVHGPCVGVGMSLALSADLIYATPDGVLPARVREHRARARRRLVGLHPRAHRAGAGDRAGDARRATARRARGRMGPRQRRRSPPRTSAPTWPRLVGRLATGPTASYAGTKRQLNAWAYGRLDEQLELEASIQQEMAATGDFAEGVTAFIQKRDAAFSGT